MSLFPWQESRWQRLAAVIDQGRLPHALLLAGPEGVGVPEFAMHLANVLLCQVPTANQACGQCRSCVLFAAGTHPDLVCLAPEEGSRQIRVDAVRELLDFIHLSSQFARHKIALIDPADRLNRSAANGLLKTLEEPPPASLLILSCRQPGRLPITLRSRCQRVDFNRVDVEEARGWLQEQLALDADGATALLDRSDGAPLLALELATAETPDHELEVVEDLRVLAAEAANPVAVAERWNDYGAAQVLGWLIRILARTIRVKLGGAGGLPHKSRNIGHLQQIANELHLHQLVDFHDLILRNYQVLTGPFNINSQALLEEVVIQWQSVQGQRRGGVK